VIRVFDGSYEEDIDITKSVDIIGNGSDSTSLSTDGYGDHVRITHDNVSLRGLVISPYRQSAIFISARNITIHDIYISSFGGWPLFGVNIDSSRNVTLGDIDAQPNIGIGIQVMDSENVSVQEGTLSQNRMIITNSFNVSIMGDERDYYGHGNLQLYNSSVLIDNLGFDGRIGMDILNCTSSIAQTGSTYPAATSRRLISAY